MSIYHQCHHQHSCSRAIQPDRKDTMIPPRQSAVPCRHLHDAVGACPQNGSHVCICCSIGEDTPSHFPSSHRLRTTLCRPTVENRSCCLHSVFFFLRRRRHPQDIAPSNRTGLSDSWSRTHSVKSTPNADNVLVHRRLDSLSLSL